MFSFFGTPKITGDIIHKQILCPGFCERIEETTGQLLLEITIINYQIFETGSAVFDAVKRTNLDLLADSKAVFTMACGELG